MAPLIIAVVLAIFAIVLVASAVRIVRQSHVGMIERFGKYRATLSPGLHIVIPFFDRMRVVVDMRETVQPFAPQPVITEDNVTIAIDTVGTTGEVATTTTGVDGSYSVYVDAGSYDVHVTPPTGSGLNSATFANFATPWVLASAR
jgi:regulator of protease activity HflC (stomatin/prohibitin superfamily)